MEKDRTGFRDLVPIVLLIALLAFIPTAILLAPAALQYLQGLQLPDVPAPPDQAGPAAPPETAPQLTPDAEFYFRLKNTSCSTLAGNFLIVTNDVSATEISGLDDTEGGIAQSIASEYESNISTRTYVRGDWLKRVLSSNGSDFILIWKEGRVYQCGETCTMRLLDDSGWQEHLDALARMRTGCAYFGRTPLPSSANVSRLLEIRRTGQAEVNGFRCEGFTISANRQYAKELLNSTSDEDQRALLWGLAHLSGPVEECLDDGVGVTVHRNITLDLTDSYRFDFAPGGFMRVSQVTSLEYFTDSVPESFFALPS